MAYEREVARGIALLDEQVPGWRQQIRLDRLDLTNPHACILGQLYGGFIDGYLRLAPVHVRERIGWGSRHGFCARTLSVLNDDNLLTAAWVAALSEEGRP